MSDDVIINKVATIENCIKRIKEEYIGFESEFDTNYTKQDSVVLNIQRMCETCIDLATYIIRKEKLGIPQSGRDAFILLQKAGIIDVDLSQKLQAMVGFRNLAIHEYQELNLDIVKAIVNKHLDDILEFTKILLQK